MIPSARLIDDPRWMVPSPMSTSETLVRRKDGAGERASQGLMRGSSRGFILPGRVVSVSPILLNSLGT